MHTRMLDDGDFFVFVCGGRFSGQTIGCGHQLPGKFSTCFDAYKFGPFDGPLNSSLWSISTTDKRVNQVRGKHHVRVYVCRVGKDCTAKIRQVFPDGETLKACEYTNLILEHYHGHHNHTTQTTKTASVKLVDGIKEQFKDPGKTALGVFVGGTQTPEGAALMLGMNALRCMRRRTHSKYLLASLTDAELIKHLSTKGGKYDRC
jgi:hypothetical protein